MIIKWKKEYSSDLYPGGTSLAGGDAELGEEVLLPNQELEEVNRSDFDEPWPDFRFGDRSDEAEAVLQQEDNASVRNETVSFMAFVDRSI